MAVVPDAFSPVADPVSAQHLVFGETIRMFRYTKGWSQEAFASHTGLDRGYTGRIERGEANIALANILRIASTLGVPVADIFAEYERRAARDPRVRRAASMNDNGPRKREPSPSSE